MKTHYAESVRRPEMNMRTFILHMFYAVLLVAALWVSYDIGRFEGETRTEEVRR